MTSEEKIVLNAIPEDRFVQLHEVWLLLDKSLPNETQYGFTKRHDNFIRIVKLLIKRELLHIDVVDKNRVYKRKTVKEVIAMMV